MDVINVVEQGCIIKKQDIRFVVYKEGVMKEYISYFSISKIILWGNQTITPQALTLAFEKGIDVIFLSLGGRFKGKLEGAKSKDIYLRLAQYESWRDKDNKLKLAKIIIKNKINNQYKLLKYYKVNNEELISIKNKVDNACDNNMLMGYEGIASKIYFGNFKNTLKGEFEFNVRSRRPPRDEINAMLSLTYSMVLTYIIIELEAKGLDPYLGFLHTLRYGREALALDLLEEFRQGICDPFVIKLVNRKEFKKSDFIYKEETGMRFTEEAFRRYLIKFNKEMESWRILITEQVNKIKDTIIKEILYEGFEFNKRRGKTNITEDNLPL